MANKMRLTKYFDPSSDDIVVINEKTGTAYTMNCHGHNEFFSAEEVANHERGIDNSNFWDRVNVSNVYGWEPSSILR